jgi:hypothetical protein
MSENAPPTAAPPAEPTAAPPGPPTDTASATPTAAPRVVPRGVKWLGMFALLIALTKFIFGFLGLGLGAVLGFTTNLFLGDGFWGGAGAGAVQLVGALIWAAVGFGLRGLKQWAWLVAVFAAGVSAFSGIESFLTGGTLWPILGVIEIVLAVGILIYLFRPHVSGAFGR